MDLKAKRILVAGFARTGQAVVDFLATQDTRIVVSEERDAPELRDIAARYPNARFEFGPHNTASFVNSDLIILSPGIPDTIQPLAEARRSGVSVWSEIELAFHFLRGTLIGITGTNGKSTTTELSGAMLKEKYDRTFVCGNIGTPLVRFCRDSREGDYYVIELSSFQLETIQHFRPHIAAAINLAEDHLDRYPDLESYFEAKMRLFENLQQNDFAVLNFDDPYLRKRAEKMASHRFWFSRKEPPPSGIYADDGLIKTIAGGSVLNFSLGRLQGIHNLENTLCAASIGMLCGVPPKQMQHAIENFRGLPHRMELVGEASGVRFYDDSKATNVDAVVKSLESFPNSIILIMGGKDKGCDYRLLRDLVKERVKALLLIGEAKEKIAETLGDLKQPIFFGTLQEAVEGAAKTAVPGDVVLLSPACSSFDMFTNYEERGRVFAEAVKKTTKTIRH